MITPPIVHIISGTIICHTILDSFDELIELLFHLIFSELYHVLAWLLLPVCLIEFMVKLG